VQLFGSYYQVCALLTSADLICWGMGTNGRNGQKSKDSIGSSNKPSAVGVVQVGEKVISAGVAYYGVWMITASQRLKTMGSSSNGELGYGNRNDIGDDEYPKDVESVRLDLSTCVSELVGGGSSARAVVSGPSRTRGWLLSSFPTPSLTAPLPSDIPIASGRGC
jgi:hypothetical protein